MLISLFGDIISDLTRQLNSFLMVLCTISAKLFNPIKHEAAPVVRPRYKPPFSANASR